MTHRVTVIPGDGIGPEVVGATRRAIDATGVDVDWVEVEIGEPALRRLGTALPEDALEAIRASAATLKGPIATPADVDVPNVNVTLRRELDLFANLRPCRRFIGVPSVYEDVDLIVVRENTEDVYTGVEFAMGSAAAADLIAFVQATSGVRVRSDSGISVKSISHRGSERIVRFAFEEARRRGRARVTAGHKANIMKDSDGLFLDVARRVAAQYPDIGFDDRIIDALCMQLVQAPERFDVVVLPNLYGDIVSELAAGLIGGSAVAPGGHLGDELAVFEATHGTAPRLAGRDRADPVGMLLSGAMLLRHLREVEAGDRLEEAIAVVLAEGVDVTPDLRAPDDERPAVGTRRMTDAVIERLGAGR